MKTSKLFFAILSLLVMLSIKNYSQQKQNGDFLTNAIDKSLDPGIDFFKYATGTWMKNNPIPESERAWGIGNLVQEETYERLKKILEEAENSKSKIGSNEQKIGDFYFTGMDTITRDKLGISPLKIELDKINQIKSKNDLIDVISLLKREGVGAMFGIGVGQDDKHSEQYAMFVNQGGLGLPNREYYFRKDARTENIRNEYKKHLAKMFQLLGENETNASILSDDVFKIEIFLADSCRKLEDMRDPYKNYNKMTLTNLYKISPSLEWSEIISKIGVSKVDSVIVGQPEYFRQLSNALNKFSLIQWQAYLKWHLINSFADRLNSDFEKQNFAFRGTVMTGVTKERPRWKKIQDATERAMGELLGQVYVQKYYSPATKKRYEKVVDNMISVFAERIKKLDWMSEQTKEKALSKLNTITKKVGYPDKWKDFSKLTVDKSSYSRNTINSRIFWFDLQLAKLGKPVDRMEWDMTPQTYNAYYNPSNNEIVLPAAIFIIPGVEDSLLDDAVVYSYAGASTIGHEMTHGFDDEGRQYDAKGNLTDWWTKQDGEKFNAKTQLMVDQFDAYVVLDSMHINGKATLGENIADLGGLVIGYDAFMKTDQFKERKLINGLTPEQRYWLGYAYSWLGHARNESLAQQVMTDVHSPNFLRVNGPFSDIPEFYKAFDIKEGQPMWRPENKRVKVW
jgi:putative endopeptidase